MFYDRSSAGRLLAQELGKYANNDVIVMAIPRGGVIVGEEIAQKLSCPLSLVLIRKIGHPANPEFAVCAVSETEIYCGQDEATLDKKWLDEEIKKERNEIKRRKVVYLHNRKPETIEGKTVILVDDGVATGLTYLAAAKEIRKSKPKKIVAALPVMPVEYFNELKPLVDEIVCLNIDSEYLGAVGAYYGNFPQVLDEEVVMALERSEETSRT